MAGHENRYRVRVGEYRVTLVRFDQASVGAWLKKRETPGRAGRKVELDLG